MMNDPSTASALVIPATEIAMLVGEPLLFPETAVLLLVGLDPDAEPETEFRRTVAGRVLAAVVGCLPKSPLPTITSVPLLGIPLTTT